MGAERSVQSGISREGRVVEHSVRVARDRCADKDAGPSTNGVLPTVWHVPPSHANPVMMPLLRTSRRYDWWFVGGSPPMNVVSPFALCLVMNSTLPSGCPSRMTSSTPASSVCRRTSVRPSREGRCSREP